MQPTSIEKARVLCWGQKVGYMRARKEAANADMRLPTKPEFGLLYQGDFGLLFKPIPTWTNTNVAHAAKGERLLKGVDIVDANSRVGPLILPAEYLEKAVGGDPYAPGVALVYSVAEAIRDGRRIVFIPDELFVESIHPKIRSKKSAANDKDAYGIDQFPSAEPSGKIGNGLLSVSLTNHPLVWGYYYSYGGAADKLNYLHAADFYADGPGISTGRVGGCHVVGVEIGPKAERSRIELIRPSSSPLIE